MVKIANTILEENVCCESTGLPYRQTDMTEQSKYALVFHIRFVDMLNMLIMLMYNVTLRRFRPTTLSVEKRKNQVL